MNKFLDENGLLYLWGRIKALLDNKADKGGADSVAWENVTGKPELVLKSEMSGLYRYRGSVANYAALPAEGNAPGDVWNVESTGMNYAWDGEKWDALGEVFEIQSISNAGIDAILSGE